MAMDEDTVYPAEAERAATAERDADDGADLDPARGLIGGLLCSLAMWAVLLVAVLTALAAVLPAPK